MAKKIFFRYGVLCLLLLLAETDLLAQQRTTVMLNETGEPQKYLFTPSVLPSHLVIKEGNVKLLLNIKANNLDNKGIRQMYIKRNGSNIGTSRSINQNSRVLNLKLGLHQAIEKKDPINFEETYDNPDGKIQLYPSNVNSAAFEINKQPRLVIDYEVSREPNREYWGQMGANAQHTNSTDWKLTIPRNRVFFPNTKRETRLSGTLSDYFCVYQDQPVVFENRGAQKNFITFLTGSDLRELRSIEVNGSPVRQPIIDNTGKMFYFSNQNTIEIIDLASGKLLTSKALNTIQGGPKLNINSINNEATIGFDGTLYLPISNSAGRGGIVALTAYPNLKPRWFYNTTNAVGPVSLSRDERLACFIESDVSTKKSRLVVLDNINGSLKYESAPVLGAYLNDNNYYIPPVVIETPDKTTTNVYVLNGNKSSNELYLFSIKGESTAQTPTPLSEKRIAQSTQTQNTGICQPTVTANGVFYIKDGKPTKYDFKTDKETVFNKFFGKKNNTSSTQGPIQDFSANTQIVSNASSMLFVLADDGMYTYSTYSEEFLQLLMGSNWLNKSTEKNDAQNLTIGPNAVGYGISKQNNALVAFVPKLGNDELNVELSEISYKEGYMGKNISIIPNVVVTPNTHAILLGQSISIKKGFTVQKGAELSFQIQKK